MKKTKLPSIVAILILTLVTTVMWVSFNIYRAVTAKPAPSVPEEISRPLDPNLNSQTISLIQGRLFINDADIPQTVISQSAINQVLESIATPVPSETPSPTRTPTPTDGPVSIVESPAPTTEPDQFAEPIGTTE